MRWTSTINDLRVINVRGIFLISGVQARVFNTARRCLKERGIYSDDRNKLNKTNMLLTKISREFKNGGISTPTLLICLGHLEIHVALSTPHNDFRILAQCYCVAIVSLSLL